VILRCVAGSPIGLICANGFETALGKLRRLGEEKDDQALARMSEQNRHLVYESGGWALDLARRELRARGVPVPLGNRALQIFVVLVQSAGKLVTKDELMARVWPGTIVEENTLEVHISAVRKALGPDRGTLRTSFGRGYRLVGDWAIRNESTLAVSVVPDSTRTPIQPFLTNIPAVASEVIGRAAAVQQVREMLRACRMITLSGPGGIGKTTLALEVVRSLCPAVHGDCWLVDLAALPEPGRVPSVVAGILGLKLGSDEICPESVARAIGGKRVFLVLDNCEHVIDAAARMAETVMRLCPATSIVATSREVLRIEGEHVYRVPPLDVPSEHQEESEVVLGHSAVQLFIARATALSPEFSSHGENLRTIAAICRRIDGIPLAIEFAAARAAMLGPELVLPRLDERFGLLIGGRRTALPRHQTLRATLDWSYQLLPEPERRLLRGLAVFAAGFTLEAANAVMGDKDHAACAFFEQIANLVAKSLVTVDGSGPARRWRLLETIRAYALEKLAESGEAEQAARRCAEYFRDLVRPDMHGSRVHPTADDVARYGREIGNVRGSLDWCFSAGGDTAIGIALTAGYAPVWLDLSLVVEGRERLRHALDCVSNSSVDAALTVQLHIALALTLLYTMGSIQQLKMCLAKALSVAEGQGDTDAVLEVLFSFCTAYQHSGDCREARSTAERFECLALRTGDPALAPITYRLIGNCLHYGGKQREAQQYFERMLDADVAPAYQRRKIWSCGDLRLFGRAALARVLWLRGFVDRGLNQAHASLEEAQAAGHKPTLCWVLHYGAYSLAVMTGDLIAAGLAVEMLMDLGTSLRAPFWKSLAQCWEGKLHIKRGEFGTGTVRLRTALDTCESSGWTICYPEFLGALAEGLAGLGRFTEALGTVDRALAAAERGGERWFVAELLRYKGELLLGGAGDQCISAAERYFSEALEVAREQGALSWELRVALSFARLRAIQDRPHHARQLLAPVYERFTEGFGTADLRSASAMLQSLSSVLS
jgi:predicted ATPase/DNA-binding winged helix-turn-helix (wHTH) protein